MFDPAKQVLWSRPGYLVRRLNQIHYALFYEECKTQNVTPVQYGVLTALSLSPWLDQTAIGMGWGWTAPPPPTSSSGCRSAGWSSAASTPTTSVRARP